MREGYDDSLRDRGRPLEHLPVLLSEVLEHLAPHPGGIYVDATLGWGGYSRAILEACAPSGRVVALDRDREAIDSATHRFQAFSARFSPLWGSFAAIDAHLDGLGIERVDGIVADLGLSSLQLDDPERGFGFLHEGPLDMRFDRTKGLTAAELVNQMDERGLADVLREYGDERRASAIARRIVARRPLRTTSDLRRAVVSVLGPRKGRIDPATRTFQALRIAVNREMESLDALLQKAPERLGVGGRIVVVSYHSLEDRAVKLAFRALTRSVEAKDASYRLLTKKPLTPGPSEIGENRRARSAKLRALERVQ